jgi:hypothetical protein
MKLEEQLSNKRETDSEGRKVKPGTAHAAFAQDTNRKALKGLVSKAQLGPCRHPTMTLVQRINFAAM